MILFFSGTGNSKYVARRLAVLLGDTLTDLFGAIRGEVSSKVVSEKPFVIVAPTYAWQIPHAVRDWFRAAEFSGAKDVYFVMTCGGSIGSAGKHNERLCAEKGLLYKGTKAIVMPENYVTVFSAPGREKSLSIVEKADPVIEQTASLIRTGRSIPGSGDLFGGLKSGPVNTLFYNNFMKDDKFTAGSGCIHCGLCQKLCPTANITVMDGKPVWHGRCIQCMACICHCPKNAIEYGKRTVGKPRYTCPK